MHYKNGREAKAGDTAVTTTGGMYSSVGILHSLVPGSETCNGTITPVYTGSQGVNIKDCLHIDDIRRAAEKGLIRDTSMGAGSNPLPGPHPEVAPIK